jgi:hypothetical protein
MRELTPKAASLIGKNILFFLHQGRINITVDAKLDAIMMADHGDGSQLTLLIRGSGDTSIMIPLSEVALISENEIHMCRIG